MFSHYFYLYFWSYDFFPVCPNLRSFLLVVVIHFRLLNIDPVWLRSLAARQFLRFSVFGVGSFCWLEKASVIVFLLAQQLPFAKIYFVSQIASSWFVIYHFYDGSHYLSCWDPIVFDVLNHLFFFAAYVICKKMYSFSGVVFLYFSFRNCQLFFIQKHCTAVGLGQQRSQAVGSGFESLPCQYFLRFSPNIFRYSKLAKHERVPLRNFSALWDKNFRRKILILPPPMQTFPIPEINATVKDSPTEISVSVRQKIFDGKSWYSPLLCKLFLYPKLMQQ